MFRLQAIATTFMTVLAAPSLAQAAVEQVSVCVDGLACPFCAYNIEKRVKTIEGVARDARIVTSVEKGMATFPWKEGVVFNPEVIRKAIKEAGFTPREISVTVTGIVKVEGELGTMPTISLLDEKVHLELSVKQTDRADRRESWEKLWAFSNETTGQLRVRLVAQIRSEIGDGSLEVALKRWSPVEFGAKVVLHVQDMTCEQCSTQTMRAFADQDGVIHVEADHEKDQVFIWTSSVTPDIKQLRNSIEALGFKVVGVKQFHNDAKTNVGE